MILFRIYFVSVALDWTTKETTFFNQVKTAGDNAWLRAGFDTGENEVLGISAKAYERHYKQKVATPSVAVLYRNNENEPFKAAYLKGVGNVAAWKNAFYDIFTKVIIEQPKENDNNGDNEKGSGDQDGNGTGGGGNGTGSRPCTLLDNSFGRHWIGRF